MCGELRALHDRLRATTVYVTHDQLEAMAMGDKIAVMNEGRIEQLAGPQEIYDRPASMFVADFIGSPAMNFLPCATASAGLARGTAHVRIDDTEVAIPPLVQEAADNAFVLGVRPEHVHLSADAPLRAAVYGTEYLGTTQIVTLNLRDGTTVKAVCRPMPARVTERRAAAGKQRLTVSGGGARRCARHADQSAAHGWVPLRIGLRFEREATLVCRSRPPTAGSCAARSDQPAKRRRCDCWRACGPPMRPHVIDGRRDAVPAARDVTFVFQQYSLYPHLTVFDNLAFPLRSPARRWPAARIDAKVREVARLLHIEDKLGNRATQLSGGQMQRVAIGRALVREPRVALMDEPLSSLDAKLREEMQVELKRIQRDLRATVLYVTHDQTRR
jgi:ABC-type sugar transport system ATPase subunit